MADQVDSMSDAQLRTKLAEHGFPVMPITASTRKLLVKKLKLVLENKSKPRNSTDRAAESRRSLAKYSSGEDSDIDNNVNVKEKRTRRTTGGSMLPPVSSRPRRVTPKKDSPKKSYDKDSESEEDKAPTRTREVVETVTTRRITRNIVNDRGDYETGSDSDVDADKNSNKSFRSNSRSSDYISSTAPIIESRISPPKSSVFSSSLTSDHGSSTTNDHLNAMRARLGLTSTLDRPSLSNYTSSYRSSYQPKTSTEEVESPYLSSFTRRLTALGTESAGASSILDREHPNNGGIQPRRSYLSNMSRPDIDNMSNDKKVFRSNMVSLGLVAVLALFFVGVVFLYVVKKNDISSLMDDQSNIVPICQTNIHGNRPGINCVPKDQVSYAKDLLKIIHPELTKRVADHKCGKAGVMPYLTDREVLDIANNRADTVGHQQHRLNLNNLQVLIVNNPHWGLSVVHLKNLYSKEADLDTLSVPEEVARYRSTGTVAISQLDPGTPLSCLAANTISNAITTGVATAVFMVLAYGSYRLYLYYMNYCKKKSEEVYKLVTQIVETVSQEAEENSEPYISMDHVRDALIAPHHREKMAPIWDAAVKYIQKNESRIRVEVQSVDGEDCRVWRWLSAGGVSPGRRGWQGQAFDTQQGAVNNLAVSPTQCLKIRHMFEKNDTNPNLKDIICDAILEKCGDKCNILHIEMEYPSCCVYVKCATEKDAGMVYRSLHGWWFRGHLITVKYLRLERYMQRFPNSPTAGPYLKPSLQKHSWDE